MRNINSMSTEKQKGAALFVSLMILFLMTIIGVSALNNATTDERMALNMQHQKQVFHAAESAINVVKRDITSLEQAITTGAPSTPVAYSGQTDVNADASANYIGCGTPEAGFAIGEGGFVTHEFTINGSASLGASSAQADHLQGVSLLAPMAGESC